MTISNLWFYSAENTKTNAIIIIAHGLNLQPSKMDQLSHYFQQHHCDVLRLSFGSDPEQWEKNIEESYHHANQRALVKNIPLYVLGYSLGALLFTQLIKNNPEFKIEKLALIAPATHTRFYAKIPALIGILLPNFKFKSLNFEEYRMRDFTTAAEYKKMSHIQDEVKNYHYLIPTLIIFDPEDELVDSKNIKTHHKNLPHITMAPIIDRATQLPRIVHHLMIDQQSLGALEWQKLLNNLSKHFAL